MLRSFSTTPLDVFPGHGEAEEVALHLRPALRLAERNVDEVAVRGLQVVHEHRAPHRATSRTLQPGHIVLHDVATHVPIVVVVADAHGDRPTIEK